MNNESIDAIKVAIDWLNKNKRSNNIVKFVKVIDELTIQLSYVGALVSEAYEGMNNAEDDYKIAIAKFMTEFEGSAAKGEKAAEVTHAELKKAWTGYKNLYKRLNTFMERTDKICDSHKQRISVMKNIDLKI